MVAKALDLGSLPLARVLENRRRRWQALGSTHLEGLRGNRAGTLTEPRPRETLRGHRRGGLQRATITARWGRGSKLNPITVQFKPKTTRLRNVFWNILTPACIPSSLKTRGYSGVVLTLGRARSFPDPLAHSSPPISPGGRVGTVPPLASCGALLPGLRLLPLCGEMIPLPISVQMGLILLAGEDCQTHTSVWNEWTFLETTF